MATRLLLPARGGPTLGSIRHLRPNGTGTGTRFCSGHLRAPHHWHHLQSRSFATTPAARGALLAAVRADQTQLRACYPHLAAPAPATARASPGQQQGSSGSSSASAGSGSTRDTVTDTSDTTGTTRTDERRRYQNLLVWELARHCVARELVIYPAVEEALDEDGVALAREGRERTQLIKERLQRFQDLAPDDPAFDDALNSLWEALGPQMEDDDDASSRGSPDLDVKIPPPPPEHERERSVRRLEEALLGRDAAADRDRDVDPDTVSGGEERVASLARSFERTKQYLAPTRAHPASPGKPPFETAAALLTAPLDRLLDLFRAFPRADKVPARPARVPGSPEDRVPGKPWNRVPETPEDSVPGTPRDKGRGTGGEGYKKPGTGGEA
ncbi:hypothetical protein GGR56DRAFT_686992 [Xylariaceae sp. FL0804]|nr:hypothetical protein GGR56DRAFT_686992 [Xylariaceae sp. FL0804]